MKNRVQPQANAGKPSKPQGNHEQLSVAKIAAPLTVLVSLLAILAFGTSSVHAEAPSWDMQASFLPGVLPRGQQAHLELSVIDLGDAGVSSATTPVTFTDRLPAGVKATGVGLAYAGVLFSRGSVSCEPAPPATAFPASAVTCTWQNSS